VAPTRARRKRIAMTKVVDNIEQTRQLKIAKPSDRSGRSGQGSGRGGGHSSG
jgi:hypothetical protein